MSEIKWIMKRAELRDILQDEEKQKWSHRALARLIRMSTDFVAKWRQPLMKTDLDDIESLKSRSRARTISSKLVGEAVEAKILYYRETLTEERNRRVGARGIKPYLLKDPDLKQLKVYIPKSTSTINAVLNKYGRIPKPSPRIHIPAERPDAMQVWEIDFTDVPGASSEATHKKTHQVEVFNIIDTGSSVAIDSQASDRYDAEWSLLTLIDILRRSGRPKIIRLDRDPRFIGGWQMDGFPSAMMRFLLCVDVIPEICPPRQPWKKPFVERFNRSQKQESLRKYNPETVEQAQSVVDDYRYYYNVERPNQAITCQDQPPSEAIGDNAPLLPRLPDEIDPDHWLTYWDQRTFRRTVNSNGSISIDNYRYYIGRDYRGVRVLLRLNAEEKLFFVYKGDTEIKQLQIKGLAHGKMPFVDYVDYITRQARSEQQTLIYKRRLRQRKIS